MSSNPYLDELRDLDRISLKRAVIVVIIVAVILVVVFALTPMITQLIFGQQNPNPSERF